MPKTDPRYAPSRRFFLQAGGTVCLSVALSGCLGFDLSGLSPEQLKGSGKSYSTSGARKLINGLRSSRGLQTVSSDPALQKAARNQAKLMARHQKMQHTTAPGTRFSVRMRKVGYSSAAGENIASGYDTIEKTIDAWMRSPPHRKILLERRFSRFGIAVARDDKTGRPYWALVMGA